AWANALVGTTSTARANTVRAAIFAIRAHLWREAGNDVSGWSGNCRQSAADAILAGKLAHRASSNTPMPEPTLLRCPQCRRLADASDRFCGACGATLVKSGDLAHMSSAAPKMNADRILEALRSATIGEYDIAAELGRGGMAIVFL